MKLIFIAENSQGHVEIFKFLTEFMIESEILDDIQEVDGSVKYILHYAAQHCNLDILQAIANHSTLGSEYFPFLRRRDQLTPIHYSLRSCETSFLRKET